LDILRIKNLCNICVILNSYQIELFESLDLTALDFCLWGWMYSEVYKSQGGYSRQVDTADELLSRILDAAASINKREDQLR